MARVRHGRITTFFSYKGGVGRTMALANVGFIAARAGKRVLLMDWDLEAPGLAVYYRGITDHSGASDIRRAPGVLDLFVEWRDTMLRATSASAVGAAVKRFGSGKPFEACACPLLPTARLPKGAALDIIGAGAALIGGTEPIPYAEALSRFQWADFFEKCAGGVMLDLLRRWCKGRYDLILVDSRTGLADVAGICTMQLPDEVLLCFVLNRQNTEGVADIARAVRAARGDEVAIRVSPMRVSKERPTEEADARARAQRELRAAGLESERIEVDMAKLAIASAPNIPFYETLAPFAATSTTADPLTFEYLRMTQELTGLEIDAPRIEQEWADEVRRRLQPRMTTIEYLTSLESADPDRAIEEIDRFLDGALDADPARELDPDYVRALVSAAFEAQDRFWGEEGDGTAQRALAEKAVLLLRQLHKVDERDWRVELVDALEQLHGQWIEPAHLDSSELGAEIDQILSEGPQTSHILLRRADRCLQDARMLNHSGRPAAALTRKLAQAETFLDSAPRPLEPGLAQWFGYSYGEIAIIRAGRGRRGRPEVEAQWRRALGYLDAPEHPRGYALKARAHFGLARMLAASEPEEAADQILEGARSWPAVLRRDIEDVEETVAILLAARNPAARAADFAVAMFGKGNMRPFSVAMWRSVETSQRFAQLLEQLVSAIASVSPSARRREALAACANAAEQQLHRLARPVGRNQVQPAIQARKVMGAYMALCDSLAAAGLSESALEPLRERLSRLRAQALRTER